MKVICFSVVLSYLVVLAVAQPTAQNVVIGTGQMPTLAKDKSGIIHLVYDKGDSILYVSSRDGRVFTPPSVIAVLLKLYSFAMRGPQIAATDCGLVVMAYTQAENIYAF